MSLSNFFFDDLEDEIFGHQMRQMRRMTNQMMSDPFGGFGLFGGLGIPSIMQMGMGAGPLMPRMTGFNPPPMNRLLTSAAGSPNGGVSFSSSSSSVFCMSSGGNGQPQVYKESSTIRTGPNGVKETRRTVEDSRTGTRKMAIGHHIGERSRVVEKEENVRTGQREEHEELINLDESDTEEFERDFQEKAQPRTSTSYPGNRRHQLQIEEIASEPLPAIMSAEDYNQRSTSSPSARRSIRSSPLALPSGSSRSSHHHDPSLLHPHPYNSPSRKQTKSRKIKGHLNHH